MVINNKKSFLFVFSLIIGLIIFLAYNTLNRSFTHLSKSELFEIIKGDDYKTILEMEAMAQSIARGADFHKEAITRFAEKKPALFDWESFDKKA